MTYGNLDREFDTLSSSLRAAARLAKRRQIWGDGDLAVRHHDISKQKKDDDKVFQRSPQRLALIGLPVLMVLAAGLAVVSMVEELQFWRSTEPEIKEVSAPDPLSQFTQEVRQRLTGVTAEVPARMKVIFAGKPTDLCGELSALGLPNSGWQAAPFHRDRWQCASDLVSFGEATIDFDPATVFFLLRGASEDRVDYLRLKLNGKNPTGAADAQEMVQDVLLALSRRYSWDVPESFLTAISEYAPFYMMERGVHLTVAPENPELSGDPLADRLLNIVVDFGEPDLIRPSVGFEQDPKTWREKQRQKDPAPLFKPPEEG